MFAAVRILTACREQNGVQTLVQTLSLGCRSYLTYSFLVVVFFLLGNKAEKRTREFIKAAVGAEELGRRKETNGRAPEEERAWV